MRVSIRADEREGVHDATCGRAARLHVQTCAPNGLISSGGGGEATKTTVSKTRTQKGTPPAAAAILSSTIFRVSDTVQ